MKREEADGEHQNHDDDHAYGFVFLPPDCLVRKVILLAEDLRHGTIAGQYGNERDQEARYSQCYSVRKISRGERWGAQVVADRSVPLSSSGGKQKRWDALDDDDEPNHPAHHPRELLAPLLVPDGQRVADPHVSLEAHTGEEHDASMKVRVKLEADKATSEVPEGPVVMLDIVVDEERKGTPVQQIRHGQVQGVDGGAGQGLPRQPYLKDDDEV